MGCTSRTPGGRCPDRPSTRLELGCERQRREQVVPRQGTGASVQPGLGTHPSAEVRKRLVDRRLHRVERRSADVVGEQRGVDRAVPAVVDGSRRWPRPSLRSTRQRRPQRPSAKHAARPRMPPGAHADRRRSPGRGSQPSATSRPQSASSTISLSCEVTSACSTLPGRRPGRAELGVQAFLGLGHLVGGARRRGCRAGRGARRLPVLTLARSSTPSELTQSARRAIRGCCCESTTSSSLARPWAVSSKLSVVTGGVDVGAHHVGSQSGSR